MQFNNKKTMKNKIQQVKFSNKANMSEYDKEELIYSLFGLVVTFWFLFFMFYI